MHYQITDIGLNQPVNQKLACFARPADSRINQIVDAYMGTPNTVSCYGFTLKKGGWVTGGLIYKPVGKEDYTTMQSIPPTALKSSRSLRLTIPAPK